MEVRIALPDEVKRIIRILQESGHEAYAVGGCVRDSLLGRVPEDWDITTSASPMQVKALFAKTVDTGIEHGTVTVLMNRQGFEVTTYRLDGEYEDCRHPKEVTFTDSLYEDLRRRDFTINAMAYNETDGLVDRFDGAGDLRQGVIRCVGAAEERFSEDALRIFRAARFSAQLGFEVEEKTKEAMKRCVAGLRKVSAERIRVELVKLLAGRCPDRLLLAYETGITSICLPEWDRMVTQEQKNPHHIYTVGMHTLRSIEALHETETYRTNDKKGQAVLNMAMLLHDSGKPLCSVFDEKGIEHFYGHQRKSAEVAAQVLARLKFDNETTRNVVTLVRHHDSRYRLRDYQDPSEGVRRLAGKVGHELMHALFAVQRCDVAAQAPEYTADGNARIDEMEEAYAVLRAEGQCVSIKELKVKGRDLMEIGYEPGPEIGAALAYLLEEVIKKPEKNERETLLALAKRYKRKNESYT